MNTFPRFIEKELGKRLSAFPAVGITGPRQAGKTTLAKTIAERYDKETLYLDLELPSDLARLQNAELYLKEHVDKLIIIDEVQRKPELFPLLRALIDQNRQASRFLILGSASPELLMQSSETLAGRISYLELSPFHVRELPEADINKHWLRGGFPQALFAPEEEYAFQWLVDFINSFIERDLPQFGLNAPSRTLWTLLQMLSSVHANVLNQSMLANAIGLSSPTIARYLSYLERAYFIRFLQPWHININKRLVKSPKVFFQDSGVLHSISGINNMGQLLGNPIAGASWEGYVVQQIIANLPQHVFPYFYRTKEGSELDLVLIKGNKAIMAIEVKMSSSPSLSRGNRIALEDVGRPPLYIITPNAGDYPLEENIRVCDMLSFWKYFG